MKKMIAIAAVAAVALAAFAGEHDTPQVSGDYAQLAAGEAVYAGNIAAVGTNGCAYAVNTSAVGGTLTVCGVFLHSAAAGEKVYAGNIAAVATNGLAYAVNTAAVGGTLTVCGVFQHTADAGENVTVKRGGFILENAGNITKKEIGATAYSSTNAWTVTKTSGTKTVGKIADVRDDGSVVVVVGR